MNFFLSSCQLLSNSSLTIIIKFPISKILLAPTFATSSPKLLPIMRLANVYRDYTSISLTSDKLNKLNPMTFEAVEIGVPESNQKLDKLNFWLQLLIQREHQKSEELVCFFPFWPSFTRTNDASSVANSVTALMTMLHSAKLKMGIQ